MSYNIRKDKKDEDKFTVTFDVEVSKEEFEKYIKDIYKKNKAYFQVPGFRKGKVPYNMVVSYYGKDMFYEDASKEALQDQLTKIYEDEKVIKDNDILAEVMPKAVIEDFGEEGLKASISFAKKGMAKLGKYKNVEVEVEKANVTDEDVEHEIKHQAMHNARVEVKDGKAEKGDTVNIDFNGYTEEAGEKNYFEGGKAEAFDLELGSNSFIPGFEDQLIGTKKDDKKDVKVTFPEDYHEKSLAGKEAIFEVVVHEVKETIIPEIDDELAKDLGYDTIAELKKDTKKEITARIENSKEEYAKNEVIEKVISDSDVEVSEIEIDARVNEDVQRMVQQYTMYGLTLDQILQMTGQTMEDFQKQVRPNAESNVKLKYILSEIAKKEKLEVSKEQLEEAIKALQKQYNNEVDYDTLKKQEEKSGIIEENLLQQAAMDYIFDNMKIVEVAKKKEAKEDKKDTKKENKKDSKKDKKDSKAKKEDK